MPQKTLVSVEHERRATQMPEFPKSASGRWTVSAVFNFDHGLDPKDEAQLVVHRQPIALHEPCDLELVLDSEFVEAELGQSSAHRSRELQLVLDPEFL